jgi:hypothetical protein
MVNLAVVKSALTSRAGAEGQRATLCDVNDGPVVDASPEAVEGQCYDVGGVGAAAFAWGSQQLSVVQ